MSTFSCRFRPRPRTAEVGWSVSLSPRRGLRRSTHSLEPQQTITKGGKLTCAVLAAGRSKTAAVRAIRRFIHESTDFAMEDTPVTSLKKSPRPELRNHRRLLLRSAIRAECRALHAAPGSAIIISPYLTSRAIAGPWRRKRDADGPMIRDSDRHATTMIAAAASIISGGRAGLKGMKTRSP